MATSTATSSKKKLVYKQDLDGVFRLKKVDDSASDNSSIDTHEYPLRKQKADDYFNELVDCSYTIDGESATPTGVQSSFARPRSHTTSNEIMTQLGNGKQTEKPHFDKARANSLPTTTTTHSYTSETSTSYSGNQSSRSKQLAKGMSLLKRDSREFKSLHVPSFALGVIVTALVATFKEQLARFTVGLVISGVAVMLLLVCGIATAIHLGLIKQEDIKVLGMFGTFLQESPDSSDVSSNGYRKRDDVSDIIQHYTGDNGRRKSRESLTPSLGSGDTHSPKMKHRKSNINVRPYMFDRATAESSRLSLEDQIPHHQVKQNYTLGNSNSPRHTPDSHDPLRSSPSLNRINTDSKQPPKNRRKLSSPPYPVHTPRRPRFDSVETATSTKKLPVLPSDELPFINEVKLIDSLEQSPYQRCENDHVSSMPLNNYFDRRGSSSPERQHSILGTTANYEKFIANVGH